MNDFVPIVLAVLAAASASTFSFIVGYGLSLKSKDPILHVFTGIAVASQTLAFAAAYFAGATP